MSFKDLKAKRNAETARKSAIFVDLKGATSSEDTKGLYSPLDGSNLEVKAELLTGRGLYAKANFKPGSRLLGLNPHVCVISARFMQHYCSLCTSEKQVRRCTKCLKVAYCSQSCQRQDWPIHKEECIALRRWAAASPNNDPPADSIRTIARLLWSRDFMKPDSVWWREILAMQSNRDKLSLELQESYAHLVQSLVLYMGLSSPEALRSLGIDSAKDIINVISQFTINTFTLTSPHLNAIGITICPLAALINHSCAPNAVIVFPNSSQGRYPTLQVICIRPINPGDEIVAAYVDITLPKGIRRKFLKETYAFDCKCTECIKELALDPRDCLFCLECREGLISTRKAQACSKCGKLGSLPDDVEAKLRLGDEGLEKAEKVQWENPAYALSLTMNLMGLVSPLSPPTSHPRLALMRLLQTLSIESMSTKESDTSTSVDDVIRLSAQVVAALMDLLLRGHPIRGLAIATLGRLLCVDEPEIPSDASIEQPFPPRGYQRLVLAKSTLLRAVEELEIGFGPGGGTLGTETRQMLENADRELAIFERGVRNAKESLKQTGP